LAKSFNFWVFFGRNWAMKSGQNSYFLLFKLHFLVHKWNQPAEKPCYTWIIQIQPLKSADPTIPPIPHLISGKIKQKKLPKSRTFKLLLIIFHTAKNNKICT